MRLAEIVQRELKKRGVGSLKEASRLLGISPELIRVIVTKGHVPKDRTLRIIAQKLDLELSSLVLTAHKQKLPGDVKGLFLSPAPGDAGKAKRKFPLSQEQCAYLSHVITIDEIQLVRKYRQLSDEAKIQSRGYIEYMYDVSKKPASRAEQEQLSEGNG